MRYATTAVLLFMLAGCATVEAVPGERSVIAFDFSEYSEQGFLITPEGYDGPYESIGMISMTISPAARRPSGNSRAAGADQVMEGEWVIDRITTEELVEAAYEQASDMGADAIINFNVSGSTKSPAPQLTIPEYTVSGFAIKRGSEVPTDQ